MEPAPDMSSGDGDMSTEEDMETPRSGEIQLIITPNLTSIEVGRAIEVEAVYVVDGALQPGVTFEWFLGEETQTSEVLRLENKGDQTVTVIGSTKGAGTILVRTGDIEKAQTFTVTEPILAGPPENPFEPLNLMLRGEEIDLDEVLVARTMSGWDRPLREWCDGQPEWEADGAVAISGNRTLTAERVGLGELTIDCTLPGANDEFSVSVLFRVEPRYPVVASRDYACALHPPKDGSLGSGLYCWGDNASRQIKDDDRVEHTTPQELSFNAPVRQLSLSPSHACAVDENSEVYCWGSNAGGQVDPISLDDAGPFAPRAVGLGARSAVKVCAGEQSSCALTTHGEVYCWGTNANSLFGPGATGVGEGTRNGVRAVSFGPEAPTFFHDLSCGPTHRCALAEDGSAHCWGDNLFELLGRAPEAMEDAVIYNVVQGADDNPITFEQIFAGVRGTCGVTPAGAHHCWGRSFLSEGRVPFQASLPPENRPFWRGELRSSELEADERIASVAMSGEHICAVSGSGKVFCWGEGGYGELGGFDDSATNAFGERILTPETSAPIAFDANDPMGSVATGLDFTCSSTVDGALYCWGDGSRGQLGDGGMGVTSRAYIGISPVSPFFAAGTDPSFFALSRVAAGLDYTCVNTSDTSQEVYCWGNPRWAQRGVGEPLYTPEGQANIGRKLLVGNSSQNRPRDVLGGGDRHICSNTSGSAPDNIVCWGANTHAQAGADPTELLSLFSIIDDNMADVINTPVDLIVGGRAHTCYSNYEESRAYCWGDARRGALGVAEYENTNPEALPYAVEVEGLDLVNQGGLTARDDYTCAWGVSGKEDELYCWGAVPDHLHGDAPFGEVEIDWSARKLNDPEKDKPVYAAAAGSRHLCALVEENADTTIIACYGDNSRGQKGMPGEPDDGRSRMDWNSAELPLALTAGREHTCALVADREDPGANQKVYCWGDNRFGQSGGVESNIEGRALMFDVPTLVPGLSELNILQIHAGAYHTCAIGSKPGMMMGELEFELVCWGRDSYGQVSARDTYVKPEPTVLEVLR
jgi:alpha-tubulin suppressor-like RCC1 family protein